MALWPGCRFGCFGGRLVYFKGPTKVSLRFYRRKPAERSIRDRLFGFILLGIIPLTVAAAEPGARDARTGNPASHLQKGEQADLAELNTGERIEGTVLTEHFEIRTPYGDIRLKPRETARIDFVGADRQLQRITTANSNVV